MLQEVFIANVRKEKINYFSFADPMQHLNTMVYASKLLMGKPNPHLDSIRRRAFGSQPELGGQSLHEDNCSVLGKDPGEDIVQR